MLPLKPAPTRSPPHCFNVQTPKFEPGLRGRASWIRELLPVDGSALAQGDFRPALDAIEAMRRAGQVDAALNALLILASIARGTIRLPRSRAPIWPKWPTISTSAQMIPECCFWPR